MQKYTYIKIHIGTLYVAIKARTAVNPKIPIPVKPKIYQFLMVLLL